MVRGHQRAARSRAPASLASASLVLSLSLLLAACASPAVPAPGATPARAPSTSVSRPRGLTRAGSAGALSQLSLDLIEPVSGGGTRNVPVTVYSPAGHPGAHYPLVVFSPGFDIEPSLYWPLLRAWAGAGYVVAEPQYPFTAPGAPGGLREADILAHPADLAFVISSLLGSSGAGLPIDHGSGVAVAGHSDGGDVALALAANPCCRLVQVKAALILSGAELASFGPDYFKDGSPPLLVTQGTADTVNPPPCSQQLYDQAPQPRYYLALTGADHLEPYEGEDAQSRAVEAVTTDFLDTYLKGGHQMTGAAGALGGSGQLSTDTPVAQAPGACPGAPG